MLTNAIPTSSSQVSIPNPQEIAAKKRDIAQKEAQRLFTENSEGFMERVVAEIKKHVHTDGTMYYEKVVPTATLKTEWGDVHDHLIAKYLKRLFEGWQEFQLFTKDCEKNGIDLKISTRIHHLNLTFSNKPSPEIGKEFSWFKKLLTRISWH